MQVTHSISDRLEAYQSRQLSIGNKAYVDSMTLLVQVNCDA